MVKGRLPKESNPLPGSGQPGFVASHDTTGEEDYKRTSPINPLPVKSIGDSNVKDAAVKSELELIKQGIADNKATNDLILARLDNPIDTQLTGSIVEGGIPVKQEGNFKEESVFAPNETIAPGTYSLKYIRIDDCNRYTIGARNLGSTGIEIRIRVRSNGGEWYSNLTKVAEGSGIAVTDILDVTTTRLAVFVYNIGEENDAVLKEVIINKKM